MGRTAKPWFYRQTGWWMVWINGKKEKLAKGRENKKAAKQRLLELRLQVSKNPGAEAPTQTVASVIEAYLEFVAKRLAASTLSVRGPYLQSFAETHGWRPISECKPFHMERWIHEHPAWQSDWTKCSAIRNVQVAFNWALNSRVIPENPFRGVSHHVGSPRRDMTRAEFLAMCQRASHAHLQRLIWMVIVGGGCRVRWWTGVRWWIVVNSLPATSYRLRVTGYGSLGNVGNGPGANRSGRSTGKRVESGVTQTAVRRDVRTA